MMSRVALGVLLVMALTCAAPAQSPEEPWHDRARTFLVVRIAEALNLNDQEALKVSMVIRQADERRQVLVAQRQALEDKLRTALAKPPTDSDALSKLVGDANQLDQQLALVPEESFHELQKILTIEQQAKLILFRRELQGEIRRAIQSRRGAAVRRTGRQRGSATNGD
jgi:Spy/CpxP family protein refolding chaperone